METGEKSLSVEAGGVTLAVTVYPGWKVDALTLKAALGAIIPRLRNRLAGGLPGIHDAPHPDGIFTIIMTVAEGATLTSDGLTKLYDELREKIPDYFQPV